MSSGAELLRRLRQQQQEKKTTPTSTCDVNTENDAFASIDNNTTIGARTRTTSSTSCGTITKPTIEVCLGPDCSGLGGGAVLLEIEELVSCTTSNYEDKDEVVGVRVVPGGCRDFCTMGPNVYVKTSVYDKHYSKVDSPARCRAVVDAIFDQDSSKPPAIPAAETSTETLLKRRDDGIRWKAHRKRAAKERRLRVRERK